MEFPCPQGFPREFPGKFDSSNVSRENVRRKIERTEKISRRSPKDMRIPPLKIEDLMGWNPFEQATGGIDPINENRSAYNTVGDFDFNIKLQVRKMFVSSLDLSISTLR